MGTNVIHRLTSRVAKEIVKTFRRPSRLVFGSLFYCIRGLSYFPRLSQIVLPMLPEGLMRKLGGKRIYYVIGYELFQRDHPEEAWLYLQCCLRLGPSSVDQYLLGMMCLYHGLGRFRDGMRLLEKANEQGAEESTNAGRGHTPFRVLDSVWARHIGHTATIDYVLKLGILEGRRREDTILYLPAGSPIANRFLLEQVATQLHLVEDAAVLPFNSSAVQSLHYDYLGPRLADRKTGYFWEVAGKTYKRWHQEGKGPLFKFPPEMVARGWAALHKAGVPEGAWFVALHVREGKWDGRDAGMHGVLNADIATYFPAIAEITRRGGWVVRMGDPGMVQLSPHANVIDYCHSDLRADWMDIFIAACCRFMLGTSSGPAFVPPLYGVPSVLTNWWPPAQRPWHASDLFLPKLLRKQSEGRYLTLSETLREPFSYCHSQRFLADHGVFVEDNNPEIIRAAVEEMLTRLNGRSGEGSDIAELRSNADRIYEANGAFGMASLAAEFLRHYSNLIA